MKIARDAKQDAQSLADRLHQHAIDTNPLYAESVALGWTKRWCFVNQLTDEDGSVIDPKWQVPIDSRVEQGLTKGERAEVPELKVKDEAEDDVKGDAVKVGKP